MEAFQISLILAVIFAIGEMLMMSFILISFSLSLILISFVQYLAGGYSLNRDIGIFIVLSAVVTLTLRNIFRSRRDQEKIQADQDVNKY